MGLLARDGSVQWWGTYGEDLDAVLRLLWVPGGEAAIGHY